MMGPIVLLRTLNSPFPFSCTTVTCTIRNYALHRGRLSGASKDILPNAFVSHQLYARVQLRIDGKDVGDCILVSMDADKDDQEKGQNIQIDARICDLLADSELAIALVATGARWNEACAIKSDNHVTLGTSAFPLFEDGRLRGGRYRISLSPALATMAASSDTTITATRFNCAARLDQLLKTYQESSEAIPCIPWQDDLALPLIENIISASEQHSAAIFLTIYLPSFELPVVYKEVSYQTIERLPLVLDLEDADDNLCESAYARLGIQAPHILPAPDVLYLLRTLCDRPIILSTKLTTEERQLIWKWRHYLQNCLPQAAPLFLHSIEWEDYSEIQEAVSMLCDWKGLSTVQGLALLGPMRLDIVDLSAINRVRAHVASNVIAKLDDDTLNTYMLPLVEALRYETDTVPSDMEETGSVLADLLIERAFKSIPLGNTFYWTTKMAAMAYVPVQQPNIFERTLYCFAKRLAKDDAPRTIIHRRQDELMQKLESISHSLKAARLTRPQRQLRFKEIIMDHANMLATFNELPLPLDAKVVVSGIHPDRTTIFKSSALPIKLSFIRSDYTDYPVIYKTGSDLRQDQLIIHLITVIDRIWKREGLDLKLTLYKVAPTGVNDGIVEFIPSVALATLLADETTNDTSDSIADAPINTAAMVSGNGILEYLRSLRSKNGPASLQQTMKNTNVHPEIMDNYIQSCAGYCVITYALGIGDRHLDNLLLTPNGRLFHIDFGYVFGRDPKPFPPPMKLCAEMVSAMNDGSVVNDRSDYGRAPNFLRFRALCLTAFALLRRNAAELIVNLALFKTSAGPAANVSSTNHPSSFVMEKLMLSVEDERSALRAFEALIDDSVNAMFPAVLETIHKWAQYWRK